MLVGHSPYPCGSLKPFWQQAIPVPQKPGHAPPALPHEFQQSGGETVGDALGEALGEAVGARVQKPQVKSQEPLSVPPGAKRDAH